MKGNSLRCDVGRIQEEEDGDYTPGKCHYEASPGLCVINVLNRKKNAIIVRETNQQKTPYSRHS